MHLRTRPAQAAAALAAAGALLLAGCGSGGGDGDSSAETANAATVNDPKQKSPYRATTLDQPFAKPDLKLTDTSGKPYDLRKETAGSATLIFFGYTHCPDVCPTTLADIATAKAQLPAAEQRKLKVVFISTDPKRDTPKAIRPWLDAFDKDFIGLTGDFGTVQRAAKSLAIGLTPPKVNKDGSVDVTHGTQVPAFAPDNKAHAIFMSKAMPADYAHDLPLLIKNVPVHESSGAKGKAAERAEKQGRKAASGAKQSPPRLRVSGQYIPEPAAKEMAAGYLKVRNSGGTDDRLTRASSPVAGKITMHTTEGGGMRQVKTGLDVPANGTLTLGRGGNHLMLEQLKQRLKPGQRVKIKLTFARSGPRTIEVPVEKINFRPKTHSH